MEETYIKIETAKLAKEKGFEFGTELFYCPEINNKLQDYDYALDTRIEQNGYKRYFAPTQAVLHRWIRENRGVNIVVYSCASGYLWNMEKVPGGTDLGESDYSGPNDSGCWDDWEGAMENALQVQLTTNLKQFGHWGNYAQNAIKNHEQS